MSLGHLQNAIIANSLKAAIIKNQKQIQKIFEKTGNHILKIQFK